MKTSIPHSLEGVKVRSILIRACLLSRLLSMMPHEESAPGPSAVNERSQTSSFTQGILAGTSARPPVQHSDPHSVRHSIVQPIVLRDQSAQYPINRDQPVQHSVPRTGLPVG